MVDGMYRREGIGTFQIVAVIADPLDRFFVSNVESELLDSVLPAFAAANMDITVPAVRVARNVSTSFLTSGKPPEPTGGLGGHILGIANLPGISGMAFMDLSLSVGSDVIITGGIAGGPNEWQNFMVMAHELGHNYNAAHAEADEFCRFFFLFCWNPARTIMWPAYSFRSSPEFSRGLIDGGHNNRRRLRANLLTRTP